MEKHYGIHVAKTMLQYRTDEIESVLLSEKRRDQRLLEIERLARLNGIATRRCSHQELGELAQGNKHQGVIVLSHFQASSTRGKNFSAWLNGLGSSDLIIALDGILDPRNLGACLRSANAAGAGGVILPRNRGCSITATVSRTAAGAAETTPVIHVSNLARTLDAVKSDELFVIGLDGAAEESIYEIDMTGPCALVFGTEETGLRVGTRKKCDQLARIPMYGQISSLNVSVAVGVVAFEVVRQRSTSLQSSQ